MVAPLAVMWANSVISSLAKNNYKLKHQVLINKDEVTIERLTRSTYLASKAITSVTIGHIGDILAVKGDKKKSIKIPSK